MQRQLEDLELIYQYLTGPRFRQRIEAIVEKFSSMQTDLERERKTMTRLRAKREGQIRSVIESTVGMYGDLKEIVGQSLEEIDGLAQIAGRIEHEGSAVPQTIEWRNQLAAAPIDGRAQTSRQQRCRGERAAPVVTERGSNSQLMGYLVST